jgi:hypothetical protein
LIKRVEPKNYLISPNNFWGLFEAILGEEAIFWEKVAPILLGAADHQPEEK